METDNHSVKSVAGYPSSMLFGAFKQIRQMWLQAITTGILTVSTVIAILKFEKVVMHITQVVKHVAKTHILRMLAYLIFIRSKILFFLSLFHGISRITPLTPNEWVGRHVVLQQRSLCLPT
ncbi:hypothetical protein C6503_15630 [Candidatus Poribacteria bacterium]|nr:MAG: hypothetical protein C6503_15630 [Candidatus Poribacteria bacterium]